MFTARAINSPKIDIKMGEVNIERVNEYRYLGYHLTSKLGWGKMISIYKTKIRDRMRIVRSCRFWGSTSVTLRKVLFNTFVRPLFTWLCCLVPLTTQCQQEELSRYYFTCAKRTSGVYQWNDLHFYQVNNEERFDSFCSRYWKKYSKCLRTSEDGILLYELASWNIFRKLWLEKAISIKCMYRSKRYIPFETVLGKALHWLTANETADCAPVIPPAHLLLLAEFPESFLE